MTSPTDSLTPLSAPPTVPEPHSDTTEMLKNQKTIVCSRCGSKILLANTATPVQKRVFLPLMTFKAAVTTGAPSANEATTSESSEESDVLHRLPNVPGEVLHDFWLVSDMYTFENVGVSHTVGTLKYLTCADCEIGPIGYHDLQHKDAFLVAVSRVNEA